MLWQRFEERLSSSKVCKQIFRNVDNEKQFNVMEDVSIVTGYHNSLFSLGCHRFRSDDVEGQWRRFGVTSWVFSEEVVEGSTP